MSAACISHSQTWRYIHIPSESLQGILRSVPVSDLLSIFLSFYYPPVFVFIYVSSNCFNEALTPLIYRRHYHPPDQDCVPRKRWLPFLRRVIVEIPTTFVKECGRVSVLIFVLFVLPEPYLPKSMVVVVLCRSLFVGIVPIIRPSFLVKPPFFEVLVSGIGFRSSYNPSRKAVRYIRSCQGSYNTPIQRLIFGLDSQEIVSRYIKLNTYSCKI